MKIAFFGTPAFSVPVLEAILNSGHEICVIVTQPDRPAGRKMELSASPIKTLALKHHLKILQPESVKTPEFLATYKKFFPDLNLVVAFGQIMPEELIFFPPLHSINIHASLLPLWRGAAPINAAIINGDRETGISYQFIEKGLDTGDVLHSEKMLIGLSDTAITMYTKLSSLSGDTVLKVLDMLENRTYTRLKQEASKATYIKTLHKEDGKIDFHKDTLTIYNLVRGLLPWPGAFCFLEGKKIKVLSTGPCEELPTGNYSPGQIAAVSKSSGIVIKTGDGFISLKEVQAEGGKKMEAYVFSLGQRDLQNKILS